MAKRWHEGAAEAGEREGCIQRHEGSTRRGGLGGEGRERSTLLRGTALFLDANHGPWCSAAARTRGAPRFRRPQKLVRMRSGGTPLDVSSSVTASAMPFCPHSTAATPPQSETPVSWGRGRAGEGGLLVPNLAAVPSDQQQPGTAPGTSPGQHGRGSEGGMQGRTNQGQRTRATLLSPLQTHPARNPGPAPRTQAPPSRPPPARQGWRRQRPGARGSAPLQGRQQRKRLSSGTARRAAVLRAAGRWRLGREPRRSRHV